MSYLPAARALDVSARMMKEENRTKQAPAAIQRRFVFAVVCSRRWEDNCSSNNAVLIIMTMLLSLQLLRVCCIMWWSSQAFGPPAAGDQTRPRHSNNRNENENINHSVQSYQQPAYPMHPSFALAPNMHSTFTPSSQSLPFAAHPTSSAYHNSMQPQHAFTPHQNIIQPSAQYSTPCT